MKFIKKKNLQQGEFVVYNPEVHWAKIVSPLLLFGLLFICFLSEIYVNASFYISDFITLVILAVLTVSFLLEILENIKIGFFITNKLLILLIFICPLLLYLHLSRGSVNNQFFFNEIVNNTKYILLTLSVLSGLNLILRLVEYGNEEYCITNKRLIIKRGAFSENITDIPIEKLEGISIIQGFMGSLFKYGTIRILGLGGSRPCLITIAKPYAVRRKIAMVIEKKKAIAVVQEPYPQPVVKVSKPAEEAPDIFDYGDMFNYGNIVRQFGPSKKAEE